MATSLNQNLFSQIVIQGEMDMQFNHNVISCEIDTTSAGGLVAGQAVKIVDSAGGLPKVVEAAADTDDIFGFIKY